MKTMLYKTTLTLLILPVTLFASGHGWGGRYTKEKTISKEFQVNSDALLKVDNTYGNLYITSWNENRTVIEVHIKTNGNNEEKVQKRLDEIDVIFEASRSSVSAKTVFQKERWGWNWGNNNNNVSMQINYTIKVPINNTVDLKNDYGSINLDKINGVANISCDYGKLYIGSLNADNNVLNFDYTSNSTIAYMKSGKISADYSGFELIKAENVVLSADYTSSTLTDVKNLSYSCDYGSIKIEKVNELKGNGDYITAKIGTISGTAQITSDYGSIKIDRMAASAGNLTINTNYTGVKIGYDAGYHFDFDIKLSYAGLSGDADFNFKYKSEKHSDKHYQGSYGSSGKNKVLINSDYGGVTFTKN